MQQLPALLYLFFLLGVTVAAIFVIYHISKYSFSKTNAFWGNTAFLVGLFLLLGLNALIFFRIDWEAVTVEAGVTPMTHTNLW